MDMYKRKEKRPEECNKHTRQTPNHEIGTGIITREAINKKENKTDQYIVEHLRASRSYGDAFAEIAD